jgi:hypothetical protein
MQQSTLLNAKLLRQSLSNCRIGIKSDHPATQKLTTIRKANVMTTNLFFWYISALIFLHQHHPASA